MLHTWIRKYFSEEQVPKALEILSRYGTEAWHHEQDRVLRDAIIVSRGSLESLNAAIDLARKDYRDVLIGEEVDPWVIAELRKEHEGGGAAGEN